MRRRGRPPQETDVANCGRAHRPPHLNAHPQPDGCPHIWAEHSQRHCEYRNPSFCRSAHQNPRWQGLPVRPPEESHVALDDDSDSSSNKSLVIVATVVIMLGVSLLSFLLTHIPDATPALVRDSSSGQHEEADPPVADPAESKPTSPEKRATGHSDSFSVFGDDSAIIDLNYQVFVKVDSPPRKYLADVTLSRKLEELELVSFAEHLRSSKRGRTYSAFSFRFDVSASPPSVMYWATAHWYKDKRDIRMLGITPSEERAMLASCPIDRARELIGQWLDDSPGAECVYIIYRNDDDSMSLYEMYKDGSNQESPVTSFRVRKEGNGNSTVIHVDTPSFGPTDFILLQPNGSLALCDEEGVVRVAKRVR